MRPMREREEGDRETAQAVVLPMASVVVWKEPGREGGREGGTN